MPSKTRITGHDLMDSAEVAEAFGVTPSSVQVALSSPHVFPSLAKRLPEPIRKIGNRWVWVRADVEAALKKGGE
jgi:hypothetical protein